VAAGQTGGALHTMAALQADLLKDLDHGKGLSMPQKSWKVKPNCLDRPQVVGPNIGPKPVYFTPDMM